MDKLRTAVVGVGQLGRHHARWYNNINNTELVGVYDIDQEKCGKVAEDNGVTAFKDITDLFGKIDAASIVVSTSKHYEIARQLLEKNIHCLVEKPITATVDQAEELIKIALENNVKLTVGHIERFNPAVRALKNYKIKPRFIEAHRLAAFDPRGADVAVILDLMIHDIELSMYLVKSRIDRIEASAVPVISETADIANARLTFENGAVANLTASRISLKPMRKLRVFQKSGYFSLDLAEKRADMYHLAGDSNQNEAGMRIPLGKSGHEIIYNMAGNKDEDMLCTELTSFIKAVLNESDPEISAVDATEALRIALEIERIGLSGATD